MSHPPPTIARYDRRSGTIVVEFNNGSAFMVPARSLQGLVDASESDIAEVELSGQSGLHWKHLDVDHEIAVLFSGRFGTPAFMSGSARNVSENVDRPEGPPAVEWVGPVIAFLADNLPGSRRSGWDHQFITAYQIACEALVALGQADESSFGAVSRANPEVPAILPRWDDVAVAVVYLAAQNGLITFLASKDGDESGLLGKRNKGPHQPDHAGWAARADPGAMSVLRSLGLLDGFDWTAASETIMWRDSPFEWHIDFTKDCRFINAVNDACEHMPDGIRVKMDRLTQITDEDIAAHSSGGNAQERGAPQALLSRMLRQTPDEVRATLLRIRRCDLDELFYQFWRIDGGWLSEDDAKRALEIFNDPLAIAMRKAVAARLYPHLPHLAR